MKHLVTREQVAAGIDPATERLLCTGLVVSDRVCRELSRVFRPELLVADFTRWVAVEALRFHEKHGSAPRRHIEHDYEHARRNGMDGVLSELVSDFLSGISGEHERAGELNEGYIIDRSIEYLRGRKLKIASEDVNTLLTNGQVEDAETRWAEYKRVDRTLSDGVNPFTDSDLIRAAFERQEHALFSPPGVLGQLWAPQARRQNWISVRGVVGRGKTWLLQYLAGIAGWSRLNVAFIGVGDMSREEYAWRWAVGLAGRSSDPDDCASRWAPCMDCVFNQEGSCEDRRRTCSGEGLPVELREAEFPDPNNTPSGYKPCQGCDKMLGTSWWRWTKPVPPLTWGEALSLGQGYARRMKGRGFRLDVFPSKGITPSGLNGMLERWRDLDNWIVDVLVLDYMDELGSDSHDEAHRHREADKWSGMRGLAQRWNLLAISADQSDAAGYDRETLGLGNFNEDRRRNDVMTSGMGLNQTPQEKHRGVARVAWFKQRNGRFKLNDQVCIVQDLAAGRPVVGSWWRRRPQPKNTDGAPITKRRV